MACVYILRSDNSGKKYIGSSHEDNPTARLKEHNRGNVRSAKSGRPWAVVYLEHLQNYTEARKRELFLKSGQGRLWIKENLGVERCVRG